MAKTKLPQPITRAEFEAGECFYLNGIITTDIGPYKMVTISENVRVIKENKNNLYSHIQWIENEGFIFINYTFHVPVTGKVLFKNCFKSQNQ